MHTPLTDGLVVHRGRELVGSARMEARGAQRSDNLISADYREWETGSWMGALSCTSILCPVYSVRVMRSTVILSYFESV